MEKIIEIGFVQFDDKISPVLKENDKPLIDRFYMSGKLYIEFAQENPNLYKLLFGKKYAHIRDSIMSIKNDDCSGFGALKLAIEEGQESGILKKDDSYKQAIVIWSSLHGLSSLVIDGFMDVAEIYEELYDSLFETLLAGIIANKVKFLSSLPFGEKILQARG